MMAKYLEERRKKMDKKQVLKACIEKYEKRITDLEQSFETTKKHVIEAPGSNVSHSDTSKFQQSNLALGIQKRLIEVKLAFSQLRTLSPVANDAIFVGALFSLKNLDSGEITNYLLIPEGGGDLFDVDGEEVMSISAGAPLTEAIMGKKKGDRVNFRDRVLEITEVQ